MNNYNYSIGDFLQLFRSDGESITQAKLVLHLSMMSHLLCYILLLVFLTGQNVVLVKASDYAVECGKDVLCITMAKLMAATSEINKKLDKQSEVLNAKLDKQTTKLDEQEMDLEELKLRLNKTAASTNHIYTQLERHSADLLSHDGRLKAHDVSQKNQHPLVQKMYYSLLGPKDCSDIRALGHSASGIYRVYLGGLAKHVQADVYCDFTTPGGNWLVFQRRKDGSVNFQRTWRDYAAGFGNINGEFWLGNELLFLLTSNRHYKLRIDMEDFNGQKRYAEYYKFSISSSADRYRMTVAGYTGNAGDSLAYHNGRQFSTSDADHDGHSGNYAQIYRGAWWYGYGHFSNLNGLYLRGPHKSYADGINWNHWRGFHYSMKTTEMKIAPVF